MVKRAGLDLMVVRGKGTRNFARRTFHSLRHSFSSALAHKGVSEEIRMNLTGYSSADIHRKYTHLDMESLHRALISI